jgi:DNA-binding SARP family transcriptional activator
MNASPLLSTTDPAIGPVGEMRLCLRLLGRFDVTGVEAATVGGAGQKLLALLAVNEGRLARWQAAELLYPDAPGEKAASNLRAVVWRLQRCRSALLNVTAAEIRLAPGITVDYWAAMSTAQRLLGYAPLDARELTADMHVNLREDLLPGWSDEWLVPERERFHQLRLHAMESLCERLAAFGWFGAAVDVGLAVVAVDPLRESAQRALIDAYLAEGNACEAIRQFDAFSSLLYGELGMHPSDELRNRVASAVALR